MNETSKNVESAKLRTLRALLPRARLVAMPHVPHALRALVPQVPCALCATCCHASRALCPLGSLASCISFMIYCYMQPLLFATTTNGMLLQWFIVVYKLYKPPGDPN